MRLGSKTFCQGTTFDMPGVFAFHPSRKAEPDRASLFRLPAKFVKRFAEPAPFAAGSSGG
jgi:hypothetical protein